MGGVGLGWVKASPGRLPTVRAAFPAGPDWAAVPRCPVTRPTGLLTAPRPRGGARGREMPPCLCVCALVCLRGGGGGLWHTCLLHCCSALARGSVCLVLQAPAGRLESLTLSPPGEMWAWARNLHVTRTCYPTTPRLPIGTGRRWYVARLGSDPHSLTALGTGGAASRAGSGSHGRGRTLGRWRGTRAQSVLPCPGCHQCWLHWLRRYSPRRRGGQRAPHPNGLSVEEGGGGGQGSAGGCLASRGHPQLHWSARGCAGLGVCDEVGGARAHLEVPWAGRSRDTHSGQAVSPSQPPLLGPEGADSVHPSRRGRRLGGGGGGRVVDGSTCSLVWERRTTCWVTMRVPDPNILVARSPLPEGPRSPCDGLQ